MGITTSSTPIDDDRLLRLTDIAELVGLGLTATKGVVRDRGFPDPVRLGPRVVRWWRSEVLAWLETRRSPRACPGTTRPTLNVGRRRRHH